MKASLKVPRAVWTFKEIGAHFSKGDLDLRRLVMIGAIRPALYFNRPFHPASITGGFPVVSVEEEAAVEGYLWPVQEYAKQFDNFDFAYTLFRDRPDHDEDALYFSLPEPMSLSQLLSLAVVFDENVKRLEGARDAEDQEPSRAQERTRDVMLVVMAQELYGWEPGGDRSTGATELIHRAKSLGFCLSYPTVRAHLRLAWERCPPKLDPAGDKRTEFPAGSETQH